MAAMICMHTLQQVRFWPNKPHDLMALPVTSTVIHGGSGVGYRRCDGGWRDGAFVILCLHGLHVFTLRVIFSLNDLVVVCVK